MKQLVLAVTLCAAVFVLQKPADGAVTSIGFANAAGALMQFNGNDPAVGQTGSFTFLNNGSGNNISIVGSSGTGDALGLSGSISGTYNIGAISISGSVESAPVSGSGSFSVADGSGGFLTGNLSWLTIETLGAIGGLNAQASVNVSNVAYSGNTIQDFIDVSSSPNGVATLSFQFVQPQSLTQLTQNAITTNVLSFSGVLTVPEPCAAAVLLLTAAPLGLLRPRRRSVR